MQSLNLLQHSLAALTQRKGKQVVIMPNFLSVASNYLFTGSKNAEPQTSYGLFADYL